MLDALRIIARRHLTERPLRTAITVAGVALGVSVSVAIRTANVEALRSFEDAVVAVAGRATLEVSAGEMGLDERVIRLVRRHPDVLSATPVLQQATRIASGPNEGRSLMVLGLDLLEAADAKAFRVRVDEATRPDLQALLEPEALFVGTRLAAEWDLRPGDRLVLLAGAREVRVVVRGMIEADRPTASAWDRLAVMDIAAAQVTLGLVGRLDRIDIETAPGRDVTRVANDLARVLPRSLTVKRPAQRNEQVERMVRAFQLNLLTLSAVGLLVGLLLVYNTVSFAVVQRRREIGVMRALGMTRLGVCALFLSEAAAIGLVGGAIGTVFGVGLARGLVSLVTRTVSELYVSGLTAGSDGLALGAIPVGFWIQGLLLGGGVSLLGALAPGLDAARTAPARALAPGDYESAQAMRAAPLAWTGAAFLALSVILALPGPVEGLPVFGYASAFCLLLGLSCVAPVLVRAVVRVRRRGAGGPLDPVRGRPFGVAHGGLVSVAAGQVARAPGRNGVTVSALMIGVAIMVGVGIMIQSFRRTVEVWIDQTIVADLVVAPAAWPHGDETGMLAKRLPLAWRDRIAAVSGVAAVDPYRDLTIEVQGRPIALVSRDLRVHAARSRYLFVRGTSAETLARAIGEEGVVVSEVLANTLHVREGDAVRLSAPSGERAFPVVGIFYDYATDGGKIVMDRRLYDRDWSDDTTTVLAVYLESDADPVSVRRGIEDVLGTEGRVAVIGNAELKTEILAIFDRTFTVTYALQIIAVVVAMLGIANTLLTAVLERQRELATLRAIGASRAQVRRLMLYEAAALGGLGAVLGLVGGVLLAVLLVEVINKQSFGWTVRLLLPAGLMGEAVVLAMVAALVAGYLPARWAASRPIADGLRYE